MSNQYVLEEVQRQALKYPDVVIDAKIMPPSGYEDDDGNFVEMPEYVEVRFGKPFLNLVRFDDELGTLDREGIEDIVDVEIETGVMDYRKHRR